MLHVIATIDLVPGRRPDFLSLFGRIAPLVRAESGCLEYELTEDVETGLPPQGPARPDTVTIVERWESLDALRAHLAAPHMAGYGAEVKPLRLGVRLQVLRPLPAGGTAGPGDR